MLSWVNPNTMRTTFSATVRCLTGRASGEILGVGIRAAIGLGDPQTIALAGRRRTPATDGMGPGAAARW
jgi:hypothetical protein